jgi:hypothetical protein
MHYVYRIKDENGKVVYVGQTEDIYNRCKYHKQSLIGDVLEFTTAKDKEQGLGIESSLINYYKPFRNSVSYMKKTISKKVLMEVLSREWAIADCLKVNIALPNRVTCADVTNHCNEIRDSIGYGERSMQTPSQLTAAAFKMALESPCLQYKEASLIKGVKHDAVSKCKRIYKMLGLDAIDKLIAGEDVMITDINGTMKKTTSIQFIYNTLGKISKQESKIKHSYSMTKYDAQNYARDDLSMRCKNNREAQIYLSAMAEQVAAMIED